MRSEECATRPSSKPILACCYRSGPRPVLVEEVKDIMAFRVLKCAGFLWVAEVLASGSIWCGTPIDWNGGPLHFWDFELPRLPYWAMCFLIGTSVWLVCWYTMRTRVPPIVLWLLAGVLAVGVEVSTHIWCWWRVPWTKPTCLSLNYFPYYFWHHLISWFVVVTLGLGLWYWIRRKRQTASSTPTTP